ncbi:MAG: TetR/AcrR family transcriptional regulator [Spirochaetes bacterium]|nr:MAG: TetR/AcrR family transcriptional regulator [Spirochaetota bacterium]
MNDKTNSKKEKIIETATKIFSKFGMKKSTMDEIAKKIRMGKSTLYHYFKNKEEIFLTVVKRESDILRKNLIRAVTEADNPKDKFKAYAITRMRNLKELRNYYATLTDEYLSMYSFSEKIRKEFREFEFNILKEIFYEGIQKKIFDIEDPELIAETIIIVFKGFEYQFITNETYLNVENHLDVIIDVFFNGILKHKP